MELLEKEMDLELLHLDNYIKTTTDLIALEMAHLSVYNEYEGIYVNESSSFMNKMTDIFKTIIQTIKKILDKIVLAAQTKIQQIKVNVKLNDLKEKLSSIHIDKNAFQDCKKLYPNINAYVRDYKKYINELVKGYKSIYHMTLDNSKDYLKKTKEFEKELNKKYEKMLTCKEREILTSNVRETIEMTERETKNYKKSVNNIYRISENAIESLEGIVSKKPVTEATENIYDKNIETTRIIQEGAKSVTKTTKKVAKVVAFHPIEVLLLFSSKFDLWYDDKKYRKIKNTIDRNINKEMERKAAIKNASKDAYKQFTGEDLDV